MKPVPSQTDSLLLPFLLAADEREEEIVLACLISKHIEPVVEKIIRYKLQFYFTSAPRDIDIEEVGMQQLMELITALPNFADDPSIASDDLLRDILREWYEEATA